MAACLPQEHLASLAQMQPPAFKRLVSTPCESESGQGELGDGEWGGGVPSRPQQVDGTTAAGADMMVVMVVMFVGDECVDWVGFGGCRRVLMQDGCCSDSVEWMCCMLWERCKCSERVSSYTILSI